MSLEQVLRNALQRGADQLHLEGAGVEATRRRAGRIARRRKAVPAALTATALAATSATVWLRRSEPESTVVADDGSGTAPPVVDADFTWREAEGVVSGPREVVRGGDGTYYALSTAPGTRSADYPDGLAPQAIYRSTNGITWESVTLEERIVDLDERDGVLYAVGTGTATRGSAREAVVHSSSDGGANWDTVVLPSHAQAPAATVPVNDSGSTARIVVGTDVMFATLHSSYWIDFEALLTDEERAAGSMAVAAEAGIEVLRDDDVLRGEAALSAEPCAAAGCFVKPGDAPVVVRTIPWSDLGLSGPHELSIDEAFVSTDGRNWERVESPFAGHDVTNLVATPDGFVAAAVKWAPGGTPDAKLLRSGDGRTWTDVSAGLGLVERVGVVGNRLVALRTGERGGELTVVTSDDGGASWSVADLSAVVDPEGKFTSNYVAAFDAGPLGVAVVVAGFDDKSEPGMQQTTLLTSPDGVTWSVEPLNEVFGGDFSRNNWVDWVLVGENDVVVHAQGYAVTAGTPTSKTFVGTPTR